jgi:glycine/sarcosine N-methyltransferase
VAARPLYGRLAWLYDAVVESTGPAPADVLRLLARGSAGDGAHVVDAGCGSGRHAIALARAGLVVTGVDASDELVEVARRSARAAGVAVELVVADLREWRPARPADAVLCRGVLHELVEDGARRDALAALAALLRRGGDLVLDVREREASLARYAEPRVVEREAEGFRYRCVTSADAAAGVLRVSERIDAPSGATATGTATLRPWGADELANGLRAAGVASVELLPPGTTAARGDRLVALARRG